jgi:hypothetical protein
MNRSYGRGGPDISFLCHPIIVLQHPSQLQPNRSKAIFDQFSSSMNEDFVQCRAGVLNLTDDEVEIIPINDLLQAINGTLDDSGKTNSSFEIDMPSGTDTIEEIYDEAQFDPQAQSFVDECSPLLMKTNILFLKPSSPTLIRRKKVLDAPGAQGKPSLQMSFWHLLGRTTTLHWQWQHGGLLLCC